MDNIYKIPQWISVRIYTVNDSKKTAYIFNHKNNEYIVLDNYAALLYEFFQKNRSYKEIQDFAGKNNFLDEIDNFLEELTGIGLLSTSSNKKVNLYFKTKKSEISEEKMLFRNEMHNFMKTNNFLERLFIELTYNCNLNCVHCFNDKNLKYQHIKFNDIKTVIDEAFELGIFYITISGGECTINPDFLNIIKYIRKKRIAFEIYTNGQLLYDDKKLLKNIINLYPYRIALSLYSMNPDIHDTITGIKGSHFKTLSVVKYLKENNINIDIKCFLTKINIYDYEDVEKFAKDNGFSFTADYELLINPSKNNTDIRITEKQMFNLHADKDSVFFINNIKPHNISKKFFNERICEGGSTNLLISPNLDVYVCPSLKIKLGNLSKNSLTEIYKDKNPNSNLNKFKSLKKSDLKECYKKEYCKYCIYCPGTAFLGSSYMKAYKNYCKEARIRLKAAEYADKKANI